MKMAVRHVHNLPEQGKFVLSMLYHRKKGWRSLKEWERA
jgi:hypothetical protein